MYKSYFTANYNKNGFPLPAEPVQTFLDKIQQYSSLVYLL